MWNVCSGVVYFLQRRHRSCSAWRTWWVMSKPGCWHNGAALWGLGSQCSVFALTYCVAISQTASSLWALLVSGVVSAMEEGWWWTDALVLQTLDLNLVLVWWSPVLELFRLYQLCWFAPSCYLISWAPQPIRIDLPFLIPLFAFHLHILLAPLFRLQITSKLHCIKIIIALPLPFSWGQEVGRVGFWLGFLHLVGDRQWLELGGDRLSISRKYQDKPRRWETAQQGMLPEQSPAVPEWGSHSRGVSLVSLELILFPASPWTSSHFYPFVLSEWNFQILPSAPQCSLPCSFKVPEYWGKKGRSR